MSDPFVFGEDRESVPVVPSVDFRTLRQDKVTSVADRVALGFRRAFEFDDEPEFSTTDWLKNNKGYADQSQAIINSNPKSEKEAIANYTLIMSAQERAKNVLRSSGANQVMSMVLDETNLIPQIKVLKGATVLRGATEGAITAIGIEAANEALTAVGGTDFDIKNAVIQTAVVGAGTFAFGGVLGVSARLYGDAVNGARRNNRDRLIEIQAMEKLQEITAEGPTVARAKRLNGKLNDEELNEAITYNARQVSATQNGIDELEDLAELSKDDAFKLGNMRTAKDKAAAEFTILMKEKTTRLVDDSTVDGVVDAYALVGNFNPIPNPFSKILSLTPKRLKVTATAGLDMLKKLTHELASNQGNVTAGQLAGIPLRGSVLTNSITDRRTWAKANEIAKTSYAEDLNVSNARLMGQSAADLKARVTGGTPTFKQYYNEAYRKRIFGEAASTPAEKRAMDAIGDFYDHWETVRKGVGQIGRAKKLATEIGVVEIRLTKLQASLDRFSLEARSPNITARALKDKNKAIDYYKKRIEDQNAELVKYKSAKEAYDLDKVMPSGPKESFANRIYNAAAIEKNPLRFKKILSDHFKANGSIKVYDPKTKLMTRKDLAGMTDEAIDEAVQKVFDGIVNDKNVMVEGADFLDSITAPSRQIDLGNRDLWEFIHHDANYLMQKYVETSSPNARFAEMNKGKTPKQVWEEVEDQLVEDGHSKANIDMMRLNYGVLEERVMRGTQLRDPSRWDNKVSNYLKQFTTLNYLTKSGVSSISEFSKIMSEHDLGQVFKSLGRMFIDPEFRKAMNQVKTEFGDASEIAMGSYHQVVSEGMGRQVNPDDVWGKINQGNHILNMLGPVSEFFKTFDGAMRQHTLVDYMEKTLKGTATEFESAYLNRYNLSVKDMRNILDKAPIQQNGTFNLSNIDQWELAGVDAASTQKFRAAVQSGVSNTVISATPADKPIFVDGVMFMKKSTLRGVPWARKLPEDDKYKGYVRVESGIGTLPFQFQSIVMAGMNKTLGAYTSGMVRNRYAGLFGGMALGYLTVWAKTPDYIWDEMNESDKFGRAFDFASIAPLYSTLIYDSIQGAQSLNTESPFSKVLSPKFTEEPNLVDAVSMFGGPSASTVVDVARGFGDVAYGDFSQGVSDLADTIPLVDTLILGTVLDQFKQIAR